MSKLKRLLYIRHKISSSFTIKSTINTPLSQINEKIFLLTFLFIYLFKFFFLISAVIIGQEKLLQV